eukprot:364228-Chlamydomonas_euryale.AAC.13
MASQPYQASPPLPRRTASSILPDRPCLHRAEHGAAIDTPLQPCQAATPLHASPPPDRTRPPPCRARRRDRHAAAAGGAHSTQAVWPDEHVQAGGAAGEWAQREALRVSGRGGRCCG